MASSLLLSNELQNSSIKIVASNFVSINGNSSNNPYEFLIKSIQHQSGINLSEIDLVVINGSGIDIDFIKQEQVLVKYFSTAQNVISITDYLGYHFSACSLNDLWFACQCILNSYVPKLFFDIKKNYLLTTDKSLTKDSLVLVISSDITGNAFSMLLKKGD